MAVRAYLTFPSSLSEETLMYMGQAFEETASAHAAFREGNKEDGDWVAEWIFPDMAGTESYAQRLKDWVELCALRVSSDDLEAALSTWRPEEISDDQDWLQYSYHAFPPFSVGTFFIYGSHYDGEIPHGKLPLQIDAATAFGSGEHGTTKGCLEIMMMLKQQGVCPWNILDMGTGSGILAIAAWRLWQTPVLAVDNDPEAVTVTRRHLESNDVQQSAAGVTGLVSEGFADEAVRRKGPYELVIANIQAGPLKEMAGDMAAICDENGYIILSGILNEQAQDVIAIYEAQNLTLRKHLEIGEWSSLLLHKS